MLFKELFRKITTSLVIKLGILLHEANNKIERDNGLLFLSLLFHNPVNGSTTMFKRETIENFGTFDATLKRADADGDLWLRYTLLGAKVARVSGSSILYRTHPEQLSRDTKTMLYGTEVTRCRALKSIEDTTYCFSCCNMPTSFIKGLILRI